MRMRVVGSTVAAAAAVLVIGGWALALFTAPDRAASVEAQQGRALIKSEFALVDQTGRAVTERDFAGRWQLVFFGFTYCPDVCPTTLATVTAVLEELGADADKLAPLFITVDPERDTPKVMADYVAAFDPRIVGLTGSPEQVKQAAKSFRVYYAKAEQPGGSGDYTMDHSAFVCLVDPQGHYAAHFSHNEAPDKIAERVRPYIDGGKPVS